MIPCWMLSTECGGPFVDLKPVPLLTYILLSAWGTSFIIDLWKCTSWRQVSTIVSIHLFLNSSLSTWFEVGSLLDRGPGLYCENSALRIQNCLKLIQLTQRQEKHTWMSMWKWNLIITIHWLISQHVIGIVVFNICHALRFEFWHDPMMLMCYLYLYIQIHHGIMVVFMKHPDRSCLQYQFDAF